MIAGNACFNFIGDPKAIRQCIETRAAFPITDDAKAKIIISREPRTRYDDEGTEPLYPDIKTHPALVNRMKEALA